MFSYLTLILEQISNEISTQKGHWNKMVENLICKLIPQHAYIFELSPSDRKTHPEAIRLCGTKDNHFPLCYFADGVGDDPGKFLIGMVAIPRVY